MNLQATRDCDLKIGETPDVPICTMYDFKKNKKRHKISYEFSWIDISYISKPNEVKVFMESLNLDLFISLVPQTEAET